MVDDQNDSRMSFQDQSGPSGNDPEQETEQQERLQPSFPPETAGFQTRLPGEKAEAPGGGYLLTDEYGQIEYCDPRAAALLHTSAPRIVNRILAMVIPAELHQDFFERLSLVRSTRQSVQWNTPLILADRTNLLAQLTVAFTEQGRNRPPSLRWFIQEISTQDDARQAPQVENQPEAQATARQIKELQAINQALLQEIESLKQEQTDLIQARDSFSGRVRDLTSQIDSANIRLLAETARREQSERTSSQLTRKLSELLSASQVLLSTLELEPLIGKILDAASQAIPTGERGMLYLIARNTGQLEMRAMFGYRDPRIRTIASQKSNSYVTKVIQERKPLLINDVQSPAQEAEPGEGQRPVRSALIVPLILDGDIFGALCLESSEPAAFGDNDLDLLTSFGATATAAIRNALLHSEVQKLALTDSLTNLYNRRGFNELAKRELERTRRFGRPLSALMIDMDHFKEINDYYGHAEGDQVLRQVADLIKHNIREVDILGRYGGDEFDILLPETDLFVACNVAERLRQCIEGLEISFSHQMIHVSASLGVAKYTPDVTDLDSLVSRADVAMYAAKQSGRNRVEIG